jgi:hypothetical protein
MCAARRFPVRFRRDGKAGWGELHLCTFEEMEQAIQRSSRGRKPTEDVTFDEAEEPAEPPGA